MTKYGDTFYLPVCHCHKDSTISEGDFEGIFKSRQEAQDYAEELILDYGGSFTVYKCEAVELMEQDVIRCAAALAGKDMRPLDADD